MCFHYILRVTLSISLPSLISSSDGPLIPLRPRGGTDLIAIAVAGDTLLDVTCDVSALLKRYVPDMLNISCDSIDLVLSSAASMNTCLSLSLYAFLYVDIMMFRLHLGTNSVTLRRRYLIEFYVISLSLSPFLLYLGCGYNVFLPVFTLCIP